MTALRTLTIAAATSVLTLLPSSVLAQEPAVAPDSVPAAARIIARYHEAVGAAALAAVQSIHSVGDLAIPAAGVTGTLEIWQGRPNRTTMVASVPGYGEVRTGHTGQNGWVLDPIEGARLLAGPEGAQADDDAHFDSHLRPSALVDSMRTVERTTLAGYDCYKVQTAWKTGRETSDCYSVETGLLVGSVRTHHASTGPAQALILYEEYREYGQIRLPSRITTQVNGIDQVITLRSVTFDSVPDSAFTPPASIRALTGS
ncbi:MAG: hypothetical protein KFH98_05015 [Gemmatimonadetes bacterium]|nr:hypothetical protein [Gemmatimonadota bacterium]